MVLGMGGKRTEQPRPAVSQRLQDMVERAKKKHGVAPQPKPLPTPVRSTTPPPNTNPVPGSGSREVAPAPKTPSKSPGPPTPEPMSVQSNRSTPITQDCKRLRMASTSTAFGSPFRTSLPPKLFFRVLQGQAAPLRFGINHCLRPV